MSTDSPKTYSIKNYGCQMNVYDGERMAELLGSQGITPAQDPSPAAFAKIHRADIAKWAEIVRISGAQVD